MADLLVSRLPDVQLGRFADPRSASGRVDLEPDSVAVVPAVLTARTVRQVGYADGREARMRRKRRALIRDAVFAVALALILFGAWKLIAWLVGVVAVP